MLDTRSVTHLKSIIHYLSSIQKILLHTQSRIYLTSKFIWNSIELRVEFRPDKGDLMNIVRDIQSLSIFKRDASRIIKQIKSTKQPVVLTVNGVAEVVVQDAESYQQLVDANERAETAAILRQRLADRTSDKQTLDEVFNELADKHGFSLNDEEI